MKPITAKPKMNGLEAAYSNILHLAKQAGEILDFKFECIRVICPGGTTYKPDFFLVYQDHFEIHEVKGHWRSRDRVRVKEAAAVLPWIRFRGVMWEGDRRYMKGHWKFEDFKP